MSAAFDKSIERTVADLSDLQRDDTKDREIMEKMRRMYPLLTDQQLIEATEALGRYLKLAWRIAERIIRESDKATFDRTSNSSYDSAKVEDTTP
jgi:hypothetical protein